MENLDVALYVRKSRADIEQERKAFEQGTTYDTLKRHRTELIKLAKRKGYSIIEIYEEIVTGDTIDGRPEMQRLLNDVENFRYDAILVIDYDRLGRGDKKDQGRIDETFAKTDTLIITPNETIDLNTEEGMFTADTKGFLSRMEYRQIKKRLKEGKKRSITEGKDVSNKQPFGFSKDFRTKKLYPNEYAPSAKLIFELYDEIGTLHGTVEKLYELGIKTETGKDRWNYQTLKRMLKNKKYIGTMFFNKDSKRDYVEQPNSHTAIIDEELFYRVNKKLEDVKDHKTRKTYALKNPFASICHCLECGSIMKLHNLKYSYIRCSNYHCTCKFIRFETFENAVLSAISDILNGVEVNVEKLKKQDNKIDKLNTQLSNLYLQEKKLKERENNIYNFLEDGTYTREKFQERLNELNATKTEIRYKIEETLRLIEYENTKKNKTVNLAPAIVNCLDVYKLSNPTQKNKLLRSFIRNIIVYKPKKYNNELHLEIILKD